MISRTHRQWMLLAGLAVVLGGVVIYETRTEAPPATSAPAASDPSAPGRAATASGQVPVTGLNLDALQREHGGLPQADRNPFRFKERPAPRPARVVEAPPTFAPPVPTGPPPPPPIPLRLIGVIEGSPRFGLLSDGRGDVFWGKDGDIIDGRYRVLRIGPDSADLSYTDGRGRQTLRLPGQ